MTDPYIQTIKESMRQDLKKRREKDPDAVAGEEESYTARLKKKLPPVPGQNDPIPNTCEPSARTPTRRTQKLETMLLKPGDRSKNEIKRQNAPGALTAPSPT